MFFNKYSITIPSRYEGVVLYCLQNQDVFNTSHLLVIRQVCFLASSDVDDVVLFGRTGFLRLNSGSIGTYLRLCRSLQPFISCSSDERSGLNNVINDWR